jgi:hypothetical protein
MRKGRLAPSEYPLVPAENVRDDGLQEDPILRSKLRETIGTGLGYDTNNESNRQTKETPY